MSWSLLIGVILCLGFALAALGARRSELSRMKSHMDEVQTARKNGSHQARLAYPHVDLSRCIGCGSCIEACPETGVLELIHGQAKVVHGARCVGHGLCAAECPVGGIALTLGDISQRDDIPALTASFESVDRPGLYLAGEVTGHALIRTAIDHGSSIAKDIAAKPQLSSHNANGSGHDWPLDLCIVGAGPAGIACSLEAKKQGLSFLTLEQETLGGTVSRYPRRKLVMTQPVELPLHGRLKRTSYSKEELMDLWTDIAAKEDLPVRTGQEYTGLTQDADGLFEVRTRDGSHRARNVVLALGRRGTPRKLGVPGEDLPKVAYSLMDAQSYQGRRVLVVGGGDSAVEAALGLAQQPGNHVTLSYRKSAFFRIKARNEAGLRQGIDSGVLDVLHESSVAGIHAHAVDLTVKTEDETRHVTIPNDEVFVMAGGIAPFKLLKQSGVSFDPSRHETTAPLVDRGPGFRRALTVAFALGLGALAWALFHFDYYGASHLDRLKHPLHAFLRPSQGLGLILGVSAAFLVLVNLSYLIRKSALIPFRIGSLQTWMTSHLLTGILAFLLALVHSAMAPEDTVGGHALLALAVLLLTGAIGRYFYSFVPRAANGRELELEEAQARVNSISSEWGARHSEFATRVRERTQALVDTGRWKGSFVTRVLALLRTQSRLKRTLSQLKADGIKEGLEGDQVTEVLALARRAHRAALLATHFDDVRSLLSSWRYLHRWAAVLMVLLLVAHVVTALQYAQLTTGAAS